MCPLANILVGVRDCVKEGQAWSCKEGMYTRCVTLVNLLELELVWLLYPHLVGVTEEPRGQDQASSFKTLRSHTTRSNVRCSGPKRAVSCGCEGGIWIPSNLVISTSLLSDEKQAVSLPCISAGVMRYLFSSPVSEHPSFALSDPMVGLQALGLYGT